ncbi:MAG: ABC transporter permease [Oscillospiraceae bacterium]|jgi:spermidine/putrescine transport system permease protein|nr:ABC transporter permease [Oscillospiraceae bacterium]
MRRGLLRALKTRPGRLLAAPYIVWMALFTVIPLLLVVWFSFTTPEGGFSFDNFSQLLGYGAYFGRSFWLAALSTVICLVIGYPLAYAMSRETGAMRNTAMLLLMLPMWINMLLRTYAWMSILENRGLLNQLLSFLRLPTLHIINTPAAVAVGMVYNYLPFMVLPILTVIQKIDKSVVEAAQDLGGNQLTVFKRVVLPLSLPGVLSGITMVFVPGVSTFIISQTLGGGNSKMLGELIEMQFLGGTYNPYLGSAISLVMMVIVLISMAVMNRFGEGEEEVMVL